MSVHDDVNEIVKAKKAADERARAEAAARVAAAQAHQKHVDDAKAAARARWPEVKRELAEIVEAYNAQHDTLGVRLTLEQQSSIGGRPEPMALTILGDHRTLSVLFTIGDTNLMGYSLSETMPGGHLSAIPDKMQKQGAATDISGIVKKLVVGVIERSFR